MKVYCDNCKSDTIDDIILGGMCYTCGGRDIVIQYTFPEALEAGSTYVYGKYKNNNQ